MMRAMRRRTTVRRRARARARPGQSVLAVALCLAGLVLASAFLGVTVQGNGLARETTGVRTEIAAEQARRGQLEARVGLQNNPDHITRKAPDYGYNGPNTTPAVVQGVTQGGR